MDSVVQKGVGEEGELREEVVEVQPADGLELSMSGQEHHPLIEECEGTQMNAVHRRCTSKKLYTWVKTNLLLLLTAGSVVVGVILGLSVREVNMERYSNGYILMVELLGFPGEVFLRMLKMLILPLIVFSLLSGLGSLEAKVAGSLGWRTIAYYMCTTFLAVALGLTLVTVIKPGGRADIFECDNSTVHGSSNNIEVIDTILDLIRWGDHKCGGGGGGGGWGMDP
jgi:hypothetical protein